MIRHCLVKKNAEENVDATGITNLGNSRFFIKYFNNETWKTYQVNFGDDKIMLSCTWYSWRISAYPCNQFFEIFKKFPAWGWDSFDKVSTVINHT